ncbi:MAG: DUF2550 domain-containing protein [Actinomycetota bacterium]
MNNSVLIPLEVVGAFLLLSFIYLAVIAFRRRWLSRGWGVFDCSVRMNPEARGRWKLGVARYRGDGVEWFRVFDISPRPRRVFARSDLVIAGRRELHGVEALSLTPGFLVLQCKQAHDALELAMSEESYTGLASWLESAPPGQNTSVA